MNELTDRQSISAAKSETSNGGQPRDLALAIYIVLGIALLIPGLLASAKIGVESGPLSPWLGPLDQAMQEIAFGSTLRFWLGVIGSTMMGLLLLYPLRKLGYLTWISIAAWFHIHVVFGLFGPILILYHCYFGTGSTPANVALFTTLIVALSGLFGHYIYTRLSADFHGERRRAQTHLQDAIAELGLLDASPTKSKLLEDLAAFDNQSQADRHGILAGFGWGRPLRDRSRDLLSRATWLIDNQGPQQGWSLAKCRDSKARVYKGLNDHFAGLSRATRRSVYERLAGYWRLLHLPLFYITVIATGIHVWKVWDMDNPATPAVLEASATPGEPAPDPASASRTAAGADSAPAGRTEKADDSPRVPPIIKRKVATHVEPVPSAAAPTAPAPSTASSVVAASAAGEVQVAQAPTATPTAELPPTLVQTPRLATRPAASGPSATTAPGEWPDALPQGQPGPKQKDEAQSVADAIGDYLATSGAKPTPTTSAGAATPAAPPRRVIEPAAPRVASAPPPKIEPVPEPATAPVKAAPRAEPAQLPRAEPAPAPVKQALAPRAQEPGPPPRPQALGGPPAVPTDPVVELAKKTGPLGTTGKLDPATIRQRLAELKKDRTFDHNKTAFPLTGKHKTVACENCHKTTLKDTPHQCIDCHKKDDVHRGRRPKCENCHVTTNWGTIQRK